MPRLSSLLVILLFLLVVLMAAEYVSFRSRVVLFVILAIAGFLLAAIVAFFIYVGAVATQQMAAESRRQDALIELENGVEDWADGLISEDQLKSVVDGLDTPSLVSMIQAGESDLTKEHIQKVKTAKILDEL